MPDFLDDPLWYKDAVIYELHVRSFFDADNDGFGDFEGLRQKLPYLESLGVNTLWLLPFLESPLKDDGYDTADYRKVLAVHGSLDDFKAFLDEAHAREMRVITELVLNHTSDQHPWFQEARDPTSDKHDWYVWSETTDRYAGVRVIFTDTEHSNWTWDAKAGKYYWHRFFSHQPDLNYDNPTVRETMKEMMFFWLDLGVDGLRLDAVPYLYEREGTTSENLPETIAYVRELRATIEARYGPGRVLLAEANQWPEDTLPYFGKDEDGKSTGVQMAFNFPIMPRLFMALRRESRRPLVEMLEHTGDLPCDAQWALFLRNHDELTLEMVTDEERDYMYHEYAADQRFRINVGIRRRLTPLLGGDRRRIELMNALLLSLKGSPVLYYGDEIGMGDDPFLGDRNGVRTPMQWSADKNGGFSRAPHHRLFMPPINRGPYSYEFVNVEDAESDEHSLLNFMKRLLALRKQHAKVFGRGTFELIPIENQNVLAFVRAYEGEKILIVANLSRYAQSVHLPASEALHKLVPIEGFGQVAFPAFSEEPYHLVLGAHGFYWFVLEPEEAMTQEAERRSERQMAEAGERGPLPVLHVAEGLENLLVRTMARDHGPEILEELLPDFLAIQRWFGESREGIQKVEMADAVRLQSSPLPVYLSLVRVHLPEGTTLYVLPLTISYEDADHVLKERPSAALAWIRTPGRPERGLLHDATVNPDFWTVLFRWWQRGGRGRSLRGVYRATLSTPARGVNPDQIRLFTGEQSNSAAIVDEQLFIKLYRRLEAGTNPETELLDYLTGADFTFIPRLYGTIDFRRGWTSYALGLLQEALPVDTDGWGYALEMTGRFFDRVAGTKLPTASDGVTTPPDEDPAHAPERPIDAGTHPHKTGSEGPQITDDPVPVWLQDVAPEMISLARVLGIRTAELHRALARADPDASGLRPQESTPADVTRLAQRIRAEVNDTRRRLEESDSTPLSLETPAWNAALTCLDTLADAGIAGGTHLRIHGDFHLGQVLRADGEFYLLDFEGEPTRSLEERRQPDSPLRDVAGMLRSLEYAALVAWDEHANGDEALEDWLRALVEWCQTVFLEAYVDTATEAGFLPPPGPRRFLLWAYLFQKACYEIRYELNHRPDWTWLPLRGLDRLLKQASDLDPELLKDTEVPAT